MHVLVVVGSPVDLRVRFDGDDGASSPGSVTELFSIELSNCSSHRHDVLTELPEGIFCDKG